MNTLTYRQVIDLRRALSSLDAVKGTKEGEFIAFEFEVKTRLKLLRAAQQVEPAALVFERLDRSLQNECGVCDGMTRNENNGRKIAEYQRRLDEALEVDSGVMVMPMLTLTELLTKPGKPGDKLPQLNPIPQSVLNKLAGLITDE